MTKLALSLINETTVSIEKHRIEESLKLILLRLGLLGRVNIELLAVEDSKIKELNAKYRRINKATDVLSFPDSNTHTLEDNLTGSIVVSVDTAKKQASQAGVSLTKELQTLTGHGLLHLLDFHHR